MKSLTIALSLSFLIGCGSTYDTALGNLPGSQDSLSSSATTAGAPATPSTTTTGSGGTTTGGGGTGTGGTTTTAEKCSTTTTGGCFSVTQTKSTTLTASQQLRGIAVSGANIYHLQREDQGGGIIRWKIYSTPVATPTTWTQVCSILDDGKFNGGLAASSTAYYTFGDANYSPISPPLYQDVRVFNYSCIEQPKIQSPGESSFFGGVVDQPYVANIAYNDPGTLYFSRGIHMAGGGTSGYRGLAIGTLSNLALFPSTASLGGKTFDWLYNNYSGFPYANTYPKTVSSWAAWGVDTNRFGTQGSSSPILWKFQGDGTPVGWAQLPTDTYPLLGNRYLNFIAQADANTLIVVSTQASQFQMYFLDVSGF